MIYIFEYKNTIWAINLISRNDNISFSDRNDYHPWISLNESDFSLKKKVKISIKKAKGFVLGTLRIQAFSKWNH